MALQDQWRAAQAQGGMAPLQPQQPAGGYFTGADVGAMDRWQPTFAGSSVAAGTAGHGQALAQAGYGGAGGGQIPTTLPGGGYISPVQRQQLEEIERLRPTLHPIEYARMRQMVIAGQNPFTRPTLAEQQVTRPPGQLTAYQESQLTSREESRRSAEARDDYNRRRQAIKDSIDALEAAKRSATSTKEMEAINAELKQERDKLRRLPETFGQTGGGSAQEGAGPAFQEEPPPPASTPGVRWQGNRLVTDAAAPADTPAATADPRDAEYLVRKYGSAKAAREAYLRGERAPR